MPTPLKPTQVKLNEETTLWDFDQATSHSSINEFELKGGHGMMEMQSIQEEKPYIDTRTSPKEIIGSHNMHKLKNSQLKFEKS